jgi:hypothetical protein
MPKNNNLSLKKQCESRVNIIDVTVVPFSIMTKFYIHSVAFHIKRRLNNFLRKDEFGVVALTSG